MDRQEAFETILYTVDENKRGEVIDRLRDAGTRAKKSAILAEYGVDLTSVQALGSNWEEDAVELSDEQLAYVAGGVNWARAELCSCTNCD